MTGQCDERGFIEAINAELDDDMPRLVFADWLEEQGEDERAEFIRLQVQRQSLPSWDPRQLPLLVRESQLLQVHEERWRNSLPKIDGVSWGRFRRGFISTVTITDLGNLSTLVSKCRESAPIDSISINWPDSNGSFDDPSPIEGLRELTMLDTPYLDGEELNMIAWSPILATIEKLNVGQCNLSDDGIHRLTQSSHLKNLKALSVPSNSIGNNGLEAIIGSLTSLEELDVSEHENYGRYEEDPIIDESGILSLVDWPGLSEIRSLNLSGNDIGVGGLHALLRTDRCSRLKELFLRDAGLEGASTEAFARAHGDLSLDVLDLGENYLADVGAGFLARANCLGDIKTLKLDRCELDRRSGTLLADAPLFYSVRKLNLNDNPLEACAVSAILEREPPHLHTLQIANIGLMDEGVACLASSPASANLQAIDLAGNSLGDQAIELLSGSEHLRKVLVLRLENNRMSSSSMAKLMRAPAWKQLVHLESSDEGIPFSQSP